MPIQYLIIGMGVAGISAAETIRGSDSRGEITMVHKDPHGYYSLPGLAYYLSGEVSEDGLAPFTEDDLDRIGIKQVQGEAIRIDVDKRQVVLLNGSRLGYDRLLLATGSQAILPDIPGCQLDGVVKLDNLDDARSIIHHTRHSRTAVVAGGGITALEIVEGLHEHGIQVHYLQRGERYWSNILDEHESSMVEKVLADLGVKLHHRTELAEVRGQRGKVRSVITRSGEEIRCDLVAIAIGVQPRKELAERSAIKTERGILVDDHLQTDHEFIYAAGDVAQIYDPRSHKYVLDTLWALAREQGRVAGANMAGGNQVYHMSVPCNITRLAGLHTMIIGSVGKGKDSDMKAIGRGDSETWRDQTGMEAIQVDSNSFHLRLLVGEKSLVGAVLIGDQGLAAVLRPLITEGVEITPIRDRLLAPGSNLAQILVDFWARGREKHEPRGA